MAQDNLQAHIQADIDALDGSQSAVELAKLASASGPYPDLDTTNLLNQLNALEAALTGSESSTDLAVISKAYVLLGVDINTHTTNEIDRAIAAYPTPSSADATNAHVTSETNRAISAYPTPSSADATNAHVTNEADRVIASSGGGGSSAIKAIHRGVFSGSASSEEAITIPSVNMAKTVVHLLTSATAWGAAYNDSYDGSNGAVSSVYVRLGSATQLHVKNAVSAGKQSSSSSSQTQVVYVPVSWEVIEYV